MVVSFIKLIRMVTIIDRLGNDSAMVCLYS